MSLQPNYLSKAINEYSNGESRNLTYFINKLSGANEASNEIGPIIDELQRINIEIPLNLGQLFYKIFTEKKPWYKFTPEISQKALNLVLVLSTQYDDLAELFLSHICGIICSPSSFSVFSPGLDFVSMAFNSLNDFFESMPHFEDVFLKCLSGSFPAWGRPTPQLFSAIANVFKFCYTLPNVLSNNTIEKIFGLCFDLLVKIELRDQSQITSVDTIPADLPDPFNPENFEQVFEIITKNLTQNSNKHAVLLWLYCLCLSKSFPKGRTVPLSRDKPKREWSLMCAVFRNLRKHFIQSILPVQSSCAAFTLLITFMSSLRCGLSVDLLENVWGVVKNAKQNEELQINCVRYMADYLARCRHCNENIVAELLHDFAEWCVEYTYHRKGRSISHSFELMKSNHKLFYTIFEAIVYVITFRQASLFGTRAHRSRCAEIPLIQIISSPFRPLDAIEPSLRANFLSLSFAYKMNWTATMLPNEYPLDIESDPKPSFPCPLVTAVKVIPIAGHLDLFNDFVLAKRTHKRALENGNGVVSSSEESQLPEKIPRHFNLEALAKLT